MSSYTTKKLDFIDSSLRIMCSTFDNFESNKSLSPDKKMSYTEYTVLKSALSSTATYF